MLFEVFGDIVHKNYFWLVVFDETLDWIPTICNFFIPSVILRYIGIALQLDVIRSEENSINTRNFFSQEGGHVPVMMRQ